MKVNKEIYKKLIKYDIEWLVENTEDSLERKHIIQVLNRSIITEYGE